MHNTLVHIDVDSGYSLEAESPTVVEAYASAPDWVWDEENPSQSSQSIPYASAGGLRLGELGEQLSDSFVG